MGDIGDGIGCLLATLTGTTIFFFLTSAVLGILIIVGVL